MEETTTKIVHDNPDSIEIGTPGKCGAIKVYGNFNNADEFKAKIDKAIEVRSYANKQIAINI